MCRSLVSFASHSHDDNKGNQSYRNRAADKNCQSFNYKIEENERFIQILCLFFFSKISFLFTSFIRFSLMIHV